MNTLKSFDLFSGAGGLSLGFEWSGVKPVYALEQDKWAAQTYAENNASVRLDVRDICEMSDAEIVALRNLSPDVIVGGPPCQGFSHANTATKDPRDPRNSLFKEFIRFTHLIEPAACVVENVPGLIRTKMVDGTPAIRAIEEAFSSIGYFVKWKILNAADYGVPQNRERLFIVAFKSSKHFEDFGWPCPTHGEVNICSQSDLFSAAFNSVQPQVSLWDAISDLPQICAEDMTVPMEYAKQPSNAYQAEMRRISTNYISNHEPMRHTARVVERFKSISSGQSEAHVPAHLRPRKRGGNGEISNIVYDQNSRRQHPHLPCNAIVASSHTNFIHPVLHRNFTVREMMRVQSFPDNFVVHGKRAVLSKKLSIKKGYVDDVYLDQRAQIGNAVPPKLAMAIAQSVHNTLSISEVKDLNAA